MLGQELAAAFGVSPSLFSPSGDGSGQRESWRRFWISTIAPIGRILETELRAKLDESASVTFEALRASDEDGRSRAVARRATAAATLKGQARVDLPIKRCTLPDYRTRD